MSASEKLKAWIEAVRKAHPGVASKLKFKPQDQGRTISAEVPGEDRCYGVYDVDADKGEVLDEAVQRVTLIKRRPTRLKELFNEALKATDKLDAKHHVAARNCGYDPQKLSAAEIRKAHAEHMLNSKYADQHDVRLSDALGLSKMNKDQLKKVVAEGKEWGNPSGIKVGDTVSFGLGKEHGYKTDDVDAEVVKENPSGSFDVKVKQDGKVFKDIGTDFIFKQR